MAKKGGNPQNLKPIETLTSEEAKKRGSAGGKKSVQARREKKLMSQIFAEFLEREHEFEIKKGKTKVRELMSGSELVNKAMFHVINRNNAASVSLMKVIAEVTEGAKLKVDTTLNVNHDDENVRKLLEEYGITSNKN